jgi:peroxiredoxin
MIKHRPILITATVLCIVAGAVYWFTFLRFEDAPAVQFTMLDGSKPTLAEMRGSPVLVTFWGTSCVECIREMPELVRMHDDFASQGLHIIGVAMPYEPPHLVYQFQQMRQLPYHLSLDINAKLSRGFGDVRLTPTTLLVSPQGKIVYSKTGPFDVEWLRGRIKNMLEET